MRDINVNLEHLIDFRNHLVQLRQQTAAVRDDIKELASTAGQAAIAQVHPVEEYVRQQPLKSMLIAVGIGAAVSVGLLLAGQHFDRGVEADARFTPRKEQWTLDAGHRIFEQQVSLHDWPPFAAGRTRNRSGVAVAAVAAGRPR